MSRKMRVSRIDSDSLNNNNHHDDLIMHIKEQIETLISAKMNDDVICLDSLWSHVKKQNIAPDLLYKTIRKMSRYKNLIENSDDAEEAEAERNYYRRALLYVLETIAYGYRFCSNLTWPANDFSSRMKSKYRDEFEELRFINKGYFGSVYKVRHRFDGVKYAIKKIKIMWFSELNPIFTEVKIIASLNHPNIVNYKAAWLEPIIESPAKRRRLNKATGNNVLPDEESASSQEDNTHASSNSPMDIDTYPGYELKGVILYIQMYCCQQTLRQWLENGNQNMAIARKAATELVPCQSNQSAYPSQTYSSVVIDMFMQLVKGLHYVHSKGITHLDLNSNNVLLTQNEDGCSVQLGDFGLADPLQRCHSLQQGNLQSDMLSLGVLLLEMLEPFRPQRDHVAIIKNLQNGRIPPDMNAKYPEIVHVIAKLVRNGPNYNYDTAQLLEELKNLFAKKQEAGEIASLKAELAKKYEEIAKKDDEIASLKMMINQSQLNNMQ